jgi:hypothetical protein
MNNNDERDYAEESVANYLETDEPIATALSEGPDIYDDYGNLYTPRRMHDPDTRNYLDKHLEEDESPKRAPMVHIFTCDSKDAYDETQTEDSIRDGDVLIVPNEGIVGIMVEAWPVALTSEHGHFHHPTEIVSEYDESVNLAQAYMYTIPYYGTEYGQRVVNYREVLNEDELRERHNVHM